MAIYRQPCSVNNESGADKFDEFLVIRDTTRRTLSPVRSSCVDGTNGAVCKCWVGHNNRRVNRASTTPSGTRSHPVRRATVSQVPRPTSHLCISSPTTISH